MIDNPYYSLPIVFFGILLYFSLKKIKIIFTSSNRINLSRNYLPLIIISLYFLSAILIIFVEPLKWYPTFHETSYTFWNFLIYSVLLSIYLIPVLYMQPIYTKEFVQKTKLLTIIMFGMSILGIFSIVYQFPYALRGLAIGASELRTQMNVEGFNLLPNSPLTTIAVGISYFYLFYIGLFFVAVIQNKNVFLKIGLFIGSLSYLVSGLAFAARDVFIFYGLGFLFVFFYFKNILDKKTIKRINFLYLFFIGVLISFLLLISFQRFKENSRENFAYGTIGYIAQQPFVFSETVSVQTKFDYGDNRFPFFKSLVTNVEPIKRKYPYEWSFGTFIKEFYSTGGYLFIFFITIFIVPMFFIKLRSNKELNFYRHMIVTFFYFQFMTMGIFYFKLGTRAGNIYMLLLLIIYLSTYFKFQRK